MTIQEAKSRIHLFWDSMEALEIQINHIEKKKAQPELVEELKKKKIAIFMQIYELNNFVKGL